MTHPDGKRLAWLFVAALATTTAMMVSSAWAQPDPVQGPAAGVGMPTPTLPPTSPNVSASNAANTVFNADSADTTVSPPLRNTLDSCMDFWDAGTHMSKTEWRAACRRTLNGTDMGMEGLDVLAPDHAATSEGRRYRGRAPGSRR